MAFRQINWSGFISCLAIIVIVTGCNPVTEKQNTTESNLVTATQQVPEKQRVSESSTKNQRPNIVLISIDTIRADHFGQYGLPLPVTPFLDQVAKHGTMFTSMTSQAPWTMPSHYSLFTGQYVSHHGMMLYHNKAHENMVTLASVLKENGYDTAAFTGGAAMSAEFGYDKGFDIFESPGINFDLTVPAAENYLKNRAQKNTEKPLFLFLHGFDAHSPYIAPPPLPELFKDDYDSQPIVRSAIPGFTFLDDSVDLGFYLSQYNSCIRSADSFMQRFYRTMKDLQMVENTIFIFFSDHGEEFMDHGGFDHNWLSLYREDVGTPLLVMGPGISKGKIVTYPVQNVDIFPWLLDELDIPINHQIDGRHLLDDSRNDISQPVVSENFFFHYLLVDSENDYYIQNSIHFWLGTIRSANPTIPLAEAIKKEFGDDPHIVHHPTETLYIINTGFLNAQIKLCNPGDNEGCFLMVEVFDPISPEMQENIYTRQRCVTDENPDPIPGWTEQAMGKCVFSMPDGYKLDRSINDQSIQIDNWKLIHDFGDGSMELYNLQNDPGEEDNVVSLYPEMAAKLRQALKDEFREVEYREDIFSLDQLDSSTREALHALGYIQGE